MSTTAIPLDYEHDPARFRANMRAVERYGLSGDARHIPMHHDSFDGVAALYMLYHLADPREAIAESYRVLRPGGWFAACAPSRFNDPELADVLPQSLATFDAENGVEMIGEFFQSIEVERWDAGLTEEVLQPHLVDLAPQPVVRRRIAELLRQERQRVAQRRQ